MGGVERLFAGIALAAVAVAWGAVCFTGAVVAVTAVIAAALRLMDSLLDAIGRHIS